LHLLRALFPDLPGLASAGTVMAAVNAAPPMLSRDVRREMAVAALRVTASKLRSFTWSSLLAAPA
jgi:hypothetical protein